MTTLTLTLPAPRVLSDATEAVTRANAGQPVPASLLFLARLALASAASRPIRQLPHIPLSPSCRTKPTETGAGGEVHLHPTARASFPRGQTAKGSCF